MDDEEDKKGEMKKSYKQLTSTCSYQANTIALDSKHLHLLGELIHFGKKENRPPSLTEQLDKVPGSA